jgi:adenylate cyclase
LADGAAGGARTLGCRETGDSVKAITDTLRGVASTTGVRRLRLMTGLTLFTYVALHLLNHSLGNISLGAMEAGLRLQKLVWQGVLGTIVLYAALVTHFCLGLWAFYQRRHFGWTRADVLQVVLGLSIPVLLALFGTEKGYAQELYAMWVGAPWTGVLQVAVLIVAWLHGCIGVYFWLRLKPGFPRMMPLLVSIAVVLPQLALLGFFQQGRLILDLAQDPAWRAANLAPWQVGLPAQGAALKLWRNWTMVAEVGAIVLVLLARGLRAWRESHTTRSILVSYLDGRTSRVPRGFSVLEASKMAGVPHANLCGGRARCSTCRVRVIAGVATLPPASAVEQAVLDRISAGPGIRLACQLRPNTDVAVVPLLPPHWPGTRTRPPPTERRGEERFVVVMIVDMRNSTKLAETRMPFDTVFIIDRFITAVGTAIAVAGGTANGFTGDGMIATFGLRCGPQEACEQAIAAVAGIGHNVATLNAILMTEMTEQIRFGVGVHGGAAVVGEIGFAQSRVFTVLGDAANVASRLEGLCKEFGCEVVISEDVGRLSGLPLADVPLREAVLRGRAAPMLVRAVAHSTELEDVLPAGWRAARMAAAAAAA